MDIFDSAPSSTSNANGLSAVRLSALRRVQDALRNVPEWVGGVLILIGLIVFSLFYALVLPRFIRGQSDEPASAPLAYRLVDDAQAADGFTYAGGWERISAKNDGRSNGTSTRSFNIGARATLRFVGRSARVYGVTGPNGGVAAVTIDGRPYGTANFHSANKEANVIVFQSPQLGRGGHTLSLIVEPPASGSVARGYVNIDGAAYAP